MDSRSFRGMVPRFGMDYRLSRSLREGPKQHALKYSKHFKATSFIEEIIVEVVLLFCFLHCIFKQTIIVALKISLEPHEFKKLK